MIDNLSNILKYTINLSYFLLLATCGCTLSDQKPKNSIDRISPHKITMKPLDKQSITGDFDGDQLLDTLYQDNINEITHQCVDSLPDPFFEDWDTIVEYLHKQEVNVVLRLTNRTSDTLHLGIGQGLYFLINMGDNNQDGKDEIALVVDAPDYSSINSCMVFSLCKKQWTRLASFEVHESAFIGTNTSMHKGIKGYLERKKGVWMYKIYDVTDSTRGMKKLEIKGCDAQ